MKTNFNNLPDELKSNGLFCLWRYKKVKGKLSKVPYTLRGDWAKSTERASFCDFNSAVNAVSEYCGIGLGIFDGFCAVDIDHCVTDGRLSELALDVINTMNSYTEYSPSGEGVRIIFRADGFSYDKEKFYINNQKIGLEIYVSGSTNKYVTLTGNVIRDVPIAECGDKLTDILKKYMQKFVSKHENKSMECCSALSDEEVIRKAKAAKNGLKFSKLYDHGDFSDYSSHSEADLALCSMLAFWCGSDNAQIDRLFRQSGLYREKWERGDYRGETLKKAVQSSGKVYLQRTNASDDFSDSPPEEYETQQNSKPIWDKPVPFEEPNLPTFPVHTLPDTVKDYVTSLAESTQTPVDICACSVLAALALCIQGKFKIQGKPDWIEPLNLYVVSIAKPSERKSAIISAVSKPITAYEAEENKRRAPEIRKNLIELDILEKKKQKLEKKASEHKDNVSYDEIMDLANAIAELKVKKPLKLYVDDITTEKLCSALVESGRTAIISSEGGIFDLLKGMYSKNVNISVFLKAYSGDTIRVDRVNRESESIEDPALTILLTVQPSVISEVIKNPTLRERGVPGRILYCFPRSLVGTRRFNTAPIPNEAKLSYRNIIWDMLDENKTEPEIINLSPDALKLLEDFSEKLEPKLNGEYEYFSDWAAKLAGNVLRIAGILTRASMLRCIRNDLDNSSCEDKDTTVAEFTCLDTPSLVVSADTMQNAITLGSYFIHHAKAVYDFMGADETTADAKYILNAVKKRKLKSFTRRDVMRMCQKFKKAADVQPALDLLKDRGFLWEKVTESKGFQKPKGSTYLVNPILYEDG